jgi:hypothetical protein
MKTKTNNKFLKAAAVLAMFLVSNTIIAQTSTAPTQVVCIGATEPYLLNPSNATSTYQWVLSSGGTITTGQGSDAISIDWNMVVGGPHTLTVTETDVNGCAGLPKTVDVTLNILDDANFALTDYCAGTANSASSIITSGGGFAFNPIPTGGETINAITGEITGGIAGNTYDIEYITTGNCPDNSLQSVTVNALDDASFALTDYCAGTANSASSIITSGGGFAFNPIPTGGETINAITGEITGGIAGNTYDIEYITNGNCPDNSLQSVTVNALDDASFALTDYCAGTANFASAIITTGGTFSFNPMPTGGELIDALTGEITGGIAGSTYNLEYITTGICPDNSIETVAVNNLDDASFTLTDHCVGSPNAATAISTAGGGFVFNPIPTGGESIDPITGEITGGLSGISYTVEYSTTGVCADSQTQNILIYTTPTTGPIFHN